MSGVIASRDMVQLNEDERAMLAGEAGAATALAMRILVRMAPLYGASRLLPITRAHIDGCIYEGDAGLEFAERLARDGGRVRVPTSLNVISLDRMRWRELGLDAGYADMARRLGQAYLDMGATPTFTCTPYHTDARPDFGEQIAWAESNAVAFANSIIGARTNRYGDYLDISCALTGRVPAAGLHLDENRLGQVLIRLPALSPSLVERDDFYPVLGYLIGQLVDEEIAVVEALEAQPNEDQLKSLAAATATSGSVALFHLAGITPEAPTVTDAFGGRPPQRIVRLTMDDLRQARAELTTAAGDALDVVGFGSPHCSLDECRRLAVLMAGKMAAPTVEVFITTSRAVRDLLDRSGDLEPLERFGAKVTADTCIVVSPLVKKHARVLMTNSAKYAHYGPGLLGV
ncbi:MAG: aconitase X catalytic domain-containing protein, partial [Thermomicrobiales bacterium]|nr:aconitase X catalytic domain-containing protein [Thermomicrobiales bacterium]